MGAATRMVTRDEISASYPFFMLDDIEAGSLNLVDEGYFDAPAMLRWQQQKAVEKGVEYVQNEVIAINHSQSQVEKRPAQVRARPSMWAASLSMRQARVQD